MTSNRVSLDGDSFRSALGHFASGVTIVTTCDSDGVDHGMTASAFCSVSLAPPLTLVCIEKTASLHGPIADCSHFAVNVLAQSQEALARRFAAEEDNRFEGIGFTRGTDGVPLLDNVLAVLQCRRTATYEGGDHSIVVGEVEAANWRDDRPLLYYRGGYAAMER